MTFSINFNFILHFYFYVCGGGILLMCVRVCKGQKCVLDHLDLGLQKVMKFPYRCWKLNSSALEELYMILTTELSLRPLP